MKIVVGIHVFAQYFQHKIKFAADAVAFYYFLQFVYPGTRAILDPFNKQIDDLTKQRTDTENAIPVTISELGDGVFKVEMKTPLMPGQYAFLLKAGAQAYRVYDFAVN